MGHLKLLRKVLGRELGAFALAIGLTACAGDGASGPPVVDIDPQSAVAKVDENLARLQALEVVSVGNLVLDVPEEAMNCYGPCPGWEDEIAAARAASAVRLDHMVQVAEPAAATPETNGNACEQASIDANVAVLRGLGIVDIGGLVVAQPANNPNCYNLPCQEDEAAARELTCERAAKLDAIVKACSYL